MGCQCQSSEKSLNSKIEVDVETSQNCSIDNIHCKLLEVSLLNEFNQIRVNPEKYIATLDEYRAKISYDINTRTYYLKPNDKLEIKLIQGNEAIDKCIKILHKQKKLNPLIADEALCVRSLETIGVNSPLKNGQLADYTSIKYTKDLLKEKISSMTKYNILSFHYDKNAPCGRLSAFCQIVDDTGFNLIRRRNILNSKATHIGITCISACDMGIACFYIIMASLMNNTQ